MRPGASRPPGRTTVKQLANLYLRDRREEVLAEALDAGTYLDYKEGPAPHAAVLGAMIT